VSALRLAIRNLILQRRRAFVTFFAVTLGYTALSLLGGLVRNAFGNLTQQAVQLERLGHLTIAKAGFFSEGALDPGKFLFSKNELARLAQIVQTDPDVRLTSPRLRLFGVVSNGKVSTIFLAEGVVPEHETQILGQLKLAGDLKVDDPTLRGGRLRSGDSSSVAVGEQLASMLKLKAGDDATLLTATVSGMANAIDANISQVYNTGNPATNDKFVLVPFALAQRLLDTDGAERLVVLLSDVKKTQEARTRLLALLNSQGMNVEIKTWNELSLFYEKVAQLFGVLFRVVTTIVSIVLLLTILNTMLAIVAERTREIGTLRAMGMRRRAVRRLFTIEGAVLAAAGCVAALPLSGLGAWLVNSANVAFVPPISSTPVRVQVDLDPPKMLATFVVLLALGSIASYIAVRAATKRSIVDNLGHV
jgi:putative ABC transport system permease protein